MLAEQNLFMFMLAEQNNTDSTKRGKSSVYIIRLFILFEFMFTGFDDNLLKGIYGA